MGLELKVDFNPLQIAQEKKKIIDIVQAKLDAQVLKDSNFFCPLDTGSLQKSGILHTVLGSGLLIWGAPYAKAQYYGLPNKSHEHNPNATTKWFEVAKSRNKENWEKLVNEEYSKNNK